MKPKPEKRLKNTVKLPIPFDVEKYIMGNKDQIHAGMIINYLTQLSDNNPSLSIEVDKFLVSNPINLNVLLLILGDFGQCDDMAKKIILSNRNTPNSKNDRTTKPTKAELETFKEQWVAEYYKSHGIIRDRGWKKAAIADFGIDRKTLNLILE